MKPRWQDPSWLAEAHAWIESALARLGLRRTGGIEQPHIYPWSTVMRVPTQAGDVWFKANDDSLRHEAGLLELLSSRRPDCVPAPLASDPGRGWILMADAGEQLRQLLPVERDLDRWKDVLRLCAEVQLGLDDAVDTMLALGVPDLRLATLPDRYERFVAEIDAEPRFRRAAGQVAELSEALAGYGIHETIQHDDLHDGNVFVRNGEYLVFDWGDSCVSHPFHSLVVTLRATAWRFELPPGDARLERIRDAYLEPFGSFGSRAELLDAFAIAYRLGTIARSLSWYRAVQAFPEIEPEESDSVPYGLKLFLANGPIGTWQ
jgi:hypothetical protein